ncbi:Lrp/AsnC family transcriptional regulator [Kineococcus gynurae]|uniref:Lrp/AsnC family transcriptional regulator n=1 Tax=Kineococcus gynurae TaxID=452979 RepID=A0ABV5LRM7_9ACTN
MRDLDSIDLAILGELQRDGRLSNQDLADAVGLSPSPCLRRVRRLEAEGVITGYTALVDPTAVGLSITAFVQIRLDRHNETAIESAEAAIREIPEVTEAFILAGDHDYLLKITVESFQAYERLLKTRLRRIPALTSMDTTFAFGTTKPLTPLQVPRGDRPGPRRE